MTGLIVFAVVTFVLWWALQNQIEAGGGHHHAHGDDLTKIEGIGPAIAKLLHAAGIETYEDLGKASKKKLEEVLEGGGAKFNVADPTSWPKQAKLAAKGDWAALEKLQGELTGGR